MLLNRADDVESDLAGASSRVVRASFVVMDQEGVDQNAGFFRRNSCVEQEQHVSFDATKIKTDLRVLIASVKVLKNSRPVEDPP